MDSSGGCPGHTGSPEERETKTAWGLFPKVGEMTSENGLLKPHKILPIKRFKSLCSL